MEFWIDVEDSNGIRHGDGPIISALSWRYTSRLDRVGDFSFRMPASDPKASLLQSKRIVRAYARVGNTPTVIGAGIVDQVEHQAAANGEVALQVSGGNLMRELTYRSVLDLRLYDNGLPVAHAAALASVGAYAPPGWVFAPDPSPPNPLVYAYYNGDTVAAAIIKIAQKCNTHFWGGADRTVRYASIFAPSGIRAIQAGGDLAPETCSIVSLRRVVATHDLLTRVYPRGSGNADVQLTLKATTRTAPPGYTLNKAQNYIEHDAATAQYGRIERQLDYREIGPVANTSADIQSAANALFDAALEELRRAVRLEDASYTLSLASCAQVLRPMQTIRVAYRDVAAGINVDAELNILESTIEVNESGVQTTGLIVSTSDRWAQTDTQAIIGSITEGRIYQALPQLNANSYVTAYSKNIDPANDAAFRFRFGKEVTQLQQVVFEFQLLPFTSNLRGVGALSTTTASGGGSVQSAAAGGSHTHSVTVPNHTHTVTIPAHTHSVTVPNHTHSVTSPSHSHYVTVDAHTHTVTVPAHNHTLPIYADPNPTATYPLARIMYFNPPNNRMYFQGAAGGPFSGTNNNATVVPSSSSGGGQTVTSDAGGFQVSSSSSGGGSTQTSSSGGGSTQTSSSGGGSLQTSSVDGTHTHSVTIPAHVHDVTPVVVAQYGIFQDNPSNIPVLADMDYRVNGGAFAPLTDAVSLADGWYGLDVTASLIDPDTLHPVQENNKVEVRTSAGAVINIASWITELLFPGIRVVITTAAPHGLSANDRVLLKLGVSGTVQEVVVSGIISGTVFYIMDMSASIGSGGNVQRILRGTFDAQLSVRNVIQAIAYA